MHFAVRANVHPFYLEEKTPESLIRDWGRWKKVRVGKSAVGWSSAKPELAVAVPTKAADTLAGGFRAQVAEVKQELKRTALPESRRAQSLVCARWTCSATSNPWKTLIRYRPRQENLPLCGLTCLLLDLTGTPTTKHYCYGITGDSTQRTSKKPPSEQDRNLDFSNTAQELSFGP